MKKITARLAIPIMLLVITACTKLPETPQNENAMLTRLRNGVYTLDGQEIKLADGVYQERPDPDAATFIMNVQLVESVKLFGDFDRNGQADAIVILKNAPGGSGTFYHLAAVLNDVNTDTIFLGDRILLNALRVNGKEIQVALMKHGPQTPMAQPPDTPVTQTYLLIDGKLSLVDAGS